MNATADTADADADAQESFSVESARAAAAAGETAQWVGDYLASRGSDNATLAAGLAERPHHWFGPLRVPLTQLVRLAGPEPDALCRVDPAAWAHDVEAMEASLTQGWTAPPLLAELRDGELLLQDGNHRYEAQVRAGEERAWVIVWCDDDNAANELRATLDSQ